MTVASFDVSDGRVIRIRAVRDPEELRPWAREG
jgi:RNA polymerase sigma-70 factor (ECF subfamily)